MNEIKKKDQENNCFTGRDCCGSKETSNSNTSVEDKKCACMSACRWFPLVPVVLGILTITAGYFLSPSTIRIIWLAFSGTLVAFGLLALTMMRTMTRKSGKISCC